ncbi:hypothetical protein [Mesorhizobium temperatum]|uniref:hypothetical protein n=1 Tax=Mesorhizobium temperatum TaxID=241416 RepID=UPI003CC9731B
MRAATRRPVKLSNFFRKIHGPTGAVEAGSFETNRSWLALAPGFRLIYLPGMSRVQLRH